MCSSLCGRVSTTSLGAGAGLGLAGGPRWAAALWSCLCSAQILETFHTEPLPAYQKRRSSFSLCVFRGNVLVGRQERDCSPQWGCWSSLGSLSAELHLVCCNFWLFAAAIYSGPSWLKCLVSFQCLTQDPPFLRQLWGQPAASPQRGTCWAWASGQHGRTARQPLTASTGRSAVPWFAATFLKTGKTKRLFNSDHSEVLWKHTAAIFKVFVGGGCWHVRLCLILQGLWIFCKNCKCKYLAIVSYPSSPSPSGTDDAGLLYCV